MSVVINIEQSKKKKGLGFFKSNQTEEIHLKFLETFCQMENLYFGISNQVYVIENYEGSDDIRNQLMVLYSKTSFGRGFSFMVNDQFDIELRLNAPATQSDINGFFKFVEDCCLKLKLDSFLLEGEPCSIKQIKSIKDETLAFHKQLVKEQLKPGLTIFGCIYPISLEESFIEQIHQLSQEDAFVYYEKYLNDKQQMDCYYVRPLLYQKQDQTLFARYALTQDVPSIFPISNFLPFGYNQDLLDQITDWKVGIVGVKEGEYELLTEIDYHDFVKIIDLEHCERFDEKHVIVTLTKSLINRVTKK